MSTTIKHRRGTASAWALTSYILASGELGVETDTNKFKIGDGVSSWSDLEYFLDEVSLTATIGTVVAGLVGGSGEPPALALLTSGLAVAALAPIPLVFVGSSTTRGQAVSLEERYPSLVTRALQGAYPNGGLESEPRDASVAVTPITTPGVHGYNGGIGSTTSANYLSATVKSNIAAIQPRVVIHGVGGNDYAAYAIPPATFKANIEAGVGYIDGVVTHPVLHVFMHQQRIGGTFTYEWSDYGDALRELAAEQPSNRMVVDVSHFFESVGIPGDDPFGLDANDNVHLNAGGYRLLASLMLRALTGTSITVKAAPPAPPGELTVLTSDSFSGDSTNLVGRTTDTASGGTAMVWEGSSTGAALQTLGGELVRGGDGGPQFVAFANPTAHQAIKVKVVELPVGGQIHIVVRRVALTSADSYRLYIAPAGTAHLYRVSPSQTSLASAFSIAPGDVLEVHAAGDNLRVLQNGAEKINVTDTTLTEPGYAGISLETAVTSVVLDDLVIYTG